MHIHAVLQDFQQLVFNLSHTLISDNPSISRTMAMSCQKFLSPEWRRQHCCVIVERRIIDVTKPACVSRRLAASAGI